MKLKKKLLFHLCPVPTTSVVAFFQLDLQSKFSNTVGYYLYKMYYNLTMVLCAASNWYKNNK